MAPPAPVDAAATRALSLGMAPGEGDYGYARPTNSWWQRTLDEKCLSRLRALLLEFDLSGAEARGSLVVSDLGGSSGANTIDNVTSIVKSLRKRFQESRREVPEFHVFFNDLPSNDFNLLFQQLASASRRYPKEDFYAAGVPGSFYDRLFPHSSVDIFLALSLRTVPETVTDKASASYNGKRMWLNGAPPFVLEEFRKQSMEDLRNFLDSRAEELVTGGLIFIIVVIAGDGFFACGNPDPLPEVRSLTNQPLQYSQLMEYAWEELISEGILTEELGSTFNFPVFFRDPEDMKLLIEEEYTDIYQLQRFERVEVLEEDYPHAIDLDFVWSAENMVKTGRSFLGPLLTNHLGPEITDTYFSKLHKILEIVCRNLKRIFSAYAVALTRL
ncbi:hypothetical protein Mapa_018534 [Marchantia paleacea]|nr:hypothetical protein Mapa_018534 [Marchantia paleacea]